MRLEKRLYQARKKNGLSQENVVKKLYIISHNKMQG